MSDGEDAVTNEPEAAGPTFDIPGDRQYSMIRDVPWGQSADYYAELIASFTLFAEQRDRGFNGNNAKQAEQPTKGQAAPQQRSAPAQGRSAQPGKATASILDDWECDNCGGPVARKVKTGKMSSDAAICAGDCKDGRFPHHIGWLNDS